MGMERTIACSQTPSWEAIQRQALSAGLTLSLRMIDGLPAFPDEIPELGWKELRVSSPAGMMTLRQQPGQLAVVVWGNADEQLQGDCDKLLSACARAVV